MRSPGQTFDKHPQNKPAYLGDGVYASYDGFQIWLTAQRDGQTNEIAVEPDVLRALNDYEWNLREKTSGSKGSK